MSGVSIYDLVYNYIVMFYDNPASIPASTKKDILGVMAKLLSSGWTAGELQFNFDFFKGKYPGVKLELSTYFNGRSPKRINILKPFDYYYHNELRITSPPPLVSVDYNTGDIKRIIEPYYLEMRCSYTIDEVYSYYLAHTNLYNKKEVNAPKYMGGLKWLIDKYQLETVLYMIDIASDYISACDLQPLGTAMDLQNYLTQATEAFNKRMNEVKSLGDDKIVPKRRLLPS